MNGPMNYLLLSLWRQDSCVDHITEICMIFERAEKILLYSKLMCAVSVWEQAFPSYPISCTCDQRTQAVLWVWEWWFLGKYICDFIKQPGIFLWTVVNPHSHIIEQCAEKVLHALLHRCLLFCLRTCLKRWVVEPLYSRKGIKEVLGSRGGTAVVWTDW